MKFSRAVFVLSLSSSIPQMLAFSSWKQSYKPSFLKAAAIDIQETAERDIGSMEQWAVNLGVQRTEGIQLTSEDGLDWSLMTTQPIPSGSSILSVPGNMILTSSKAKEELSQYGDVEAGASLLERLGSGDIVSKYYLVLKILYEYDIGQESPYLEWLNGLPRLYYNAASMTDFCYECLPPLVFSLSRGERIKLENITKAVEKVDFLSPQTKNNKDAIKWAFSVVQTRAIGTPEEKQIVPFADMFNHGTETEIELNYDENGNLIAFTTCDVPEGSPLRVSYGCPTNPSALFATYGFLDETSPATFCKIMNIRPNQELLDMGYDTSRLVFYKDDGGIAEEVWDIVLYQVLSNNREHQELLHQSHMNQDLQTKQALHDNYRFETSSYLKNHVDKFLDQLQGLSNKAIGKDVNEHPRLPLILNHNEFVRNTFLTVKTNLDQIVQEAGMMKQA